MTASSIKIFRDFWRERTRTVLVVLAIGLGIAGFSAVLSTWAILDRELDKGYLATNPASATLRTDAVDDRLLAEVRSGHGVADAQARRVLSGRLRTPSGEWRGLTLFVVKDYGDIRISRLVPEKGAWPPGPGEMSVERDAFQVARARIGDTVTVRTTRGVERALRVTGGVHDVGQAQARMENVVYGYITLNTLASLGEEPYLDQLQILVANDRFDEKHVQAVAADIRNLLESRGHPVRRVDVPRPGRHPHADIMGLLLLGMAVFGLGVLVLSGVLVVNLLTALMAAQVRQIGVMKTIGGTRGRIARVYLAQASLLGGAAVLFALPAGIAGSRLFARTMAVFLNFDITSFTIPAWVYLLVAAVGIVVPVLAAAWPVWRVSGISVARALADAGVAAGSFGVSAFDRLLAGIGGAGRPVLLAIRNSFRRRARLVRTLVTLAVGGLFFLSGLNVRSSMMSTLDRLFRAKRFDLTASLGGVYSIEKIERAVRKTPGARAFEGWITTEGSIPGKDAASVREPAAHPGGGSAGIHGGARTAGGGGGHGGGGLGSDRFVAIALPAQTRMQGFDLLAGRGLAPEDTNAVVVNTAFAAKSPDMRVGSTVPLSLGHGSMPWRIVGITREPFSPAVAYVPKGYVDDLGGLQGMTNSLRVAVEENRTDRASIERIKNALERNLEAEGVRVVGVLSKADSRFGFDQHMVMIYVSLIVMSCVVAGVGGLGLMTTMSLNVLERRRELGVLRAIGATPTAVLLIVVAEGIVVGALSWALASAAAWPVSRAVGDLMMTRMFKTALDFSFDPAGPAIWAAVSLLLGAASSFVPAWRASKRPVREALGYE